METTEQPTSEPQRTPLAEINKRVDALLEALGVPDVDRLRDLTIRFPVNEYPDRTSISEISSSLL